MTLANTTPESRVGARAEQKRRWDRENLSVCRCGAPMARKADVCISCARTIKRASRDERWARIQELWNAGASMSDIAAALQTTRGTIGRHIFRMRRAGFDVPYRRGGNGRG